MTVTGKRNLSNFATFLLDCFSDSENLEVMCLGGHYFIILKFKLHSYLLSPSSVGEILLYCDSKVQWSVDDWRSRQYNTAKASGWPKAPRHLQTGWLDPLQYISSDTFFTLLATHKPFSTDWNAGITQSEKTSMHKIAEKMCLFSTASALAFITL